MIDPSNIDILHHMINYECDPTVVFDDSNLPSGLCDDIAMLIAPCASNIATGWAVGGDYVSENENLIISVCLSTLSFICFERLLNILKSLDILLEVILRSNTTCYKFIIIMHNKCQV